MSGAAAATAAILHLAPVARELAARPAGEWRFVGLTPQGLAARLGRSPAADVARAALPPARAAAARALRRARAQPRRSGRACDPGLERWPVAAGALVAVTAGRGRRPSCSPSARSAPLEISVSPSTRSVDDLGAGDVFAAALFVALAEGALAARRRPRCAAAAAALRLGRRRGPQAIARGAAEIESSGGERRRRSARSSSSALELLAASRTRAPRAAGCPPTGAISTGEICACGRRSARCALAAAR